MKEYTTGNLFNLSKLLLNEDNVTHRKSLKTTIAIRHMLKINLAELSKAIDIINGEINDMIDEVFEEFYREDKAIDGRRVKEAYAQEFDETIQERLDELSLQKMPINFVYVSADEVNKYFAINDGELTESEMDAIESFIKDTDFESDTPEQ